LPAPNPPLPARNDCFGQQVERVGSVAPTALPGGGELLRVRLLWQSIQATERPYTAFVQLLGVSVNPATGNHIWAQVDAQPDPTSPTDNWLPGELALDEQALPLPASLPGGSYQLIVGLYDPGDGRRLALPDGTDFAILSVYPAPS